MNGTICSLEHNASGLTAYLHETDRESWKTDLRMHDEIERGDNDTIKFARTGIAGSTADVGCCGAASGAK